MQRSANVGLYVLAGHRFVDPAQLRLTHCAQINLCVQWKEREDRFVVHVTKSDLKHNHVLSKASYGQYAAVRMALSGDVLDTVDLLRKAGAKKAKIHKYILDNSSDESNARVVSDIISRLKQRDRDLTTAERLRTWMKDFCEEEGGSVGRIFTKRQHDKVHVSV